MSRENWCKHYRAMARFDTCNAGIEYSTFDGRSHAKKPCFNRCGGCDAAVYRTPEEVAAEKAAWEKRFANIAVARAAIVAHLGGPWKRGAPGATGDIDCPVCGGKDALQFSRSGYNGHIHARCLTGGCVSWME